MQAPLLMEVDSLVEPLVFRPVLTRASGGLRPSTVRCVLTVGAAPGPPEALAATL